MDNMLKIINSLWQSGILTTVAIFVIRWMLAHTEDVISGKRAKNIKLVETWALQAVQFADRNANANFDKKNVATHYLADQLHANKLVKRFSENEIDTMIEIAVKEIRGKENG